MARHCDRPGCSERGAIAYGFDPDRVLVWLAVLDPDADRARSGVLCVRHADAMVVPVGWTLEDARDPMPRLFKPAPRTRKPRSPRRSPSSKPRSGKQVDPSDQLTLGTTSVPSDLPVDRRTIVEVTGVASAPDDPDATVALPWIPDFDVTDDLGGVLQADSPLLARAFRGTRRRT